PSSIYGTGGGEAFYEKSKLAQAGVLFAGPFANFVLAFLFSTATFVIGTSVVIDEGNQATAANPRVLVTEVLLGSPAEKAGLTVGDEVVSLTRDNLTTAVHAPEDVTETISAFDGPLTVSVMHRGELVSFVVTPTLGIIPNEPERKAVGVATSLVGTVSLPIHKAIASGFTETIEKLMLVAEGLFFLIASVFTLSADLSGIAGPVGIASLTGEVAAFGIGSLLSFAALISLNLFIINLLPFPALDGGRLAFLAIETVFRRKIPSRFSNALNTLGFVLLIALMVAVTAHDISRLVG
ncbi:MAG TPA: M50 family metallopeptidase, partial [Candidatus Paceibacterota bacterium]